jgi:hypothetical protein
MQKWKTWLTLGVIFLSGVVIGALGMGFYLEKKIERILSGDTHVLVELAMNRLSHELGLTVNQQQQFAPLVEEAAHKLNKLRQQQRPKVEAILEQAITRTQPHLNPQQQQKLAEIWLKFKVWHDPERINPD